MIEEGLYAYLIADADIAAIVTDRVYINRLPQEPVLPALTYSNISGVPFMTMNKKGSMDRTRFQIDCWGVDAFEAKTLARKVRAALEGYKGLMGSETVGGVIPIEVGMDDFDDVTSAFRVISEYDILHDV